MLAISIRQPWAELFMRGEKQPFDHARHGRVLVENRNGPTKVRGKIYLYAGLGRYSREEENAIVKSHRIEDIEALPRGVIVGTMELIDCDGGEWYMTNPERWDEPRKPTRRANPIWFYPWDEDVPQQSRS